jgi:hypothetical protein
MWCPPAVSIDALHLVEQFPPGYHSFIFDKYALSIKWMTAKSFYYKVCRDVIGFCLLANSFKTEKSGVIYSLCLQTFLSLGKRSIKYSNSIIGLLKWHFDWERWWMSFRGQFGLGTNFDKTRYQFFFMMLTCLAPIHHFSTCHSVV